MSKKLNKIIIGLTVTLIMMIANIAGASTLKAYTSEQEKQNTSVDEIQGETITRVVEGDLRKVKEETNIRWKSIDLKLEAKSAKINNPKEPEMIGKAEFSVEKTSDLTKAKENTHTDVAEYGDTIKYTIIIKNKGNAAGTIKIKDSVPAGTTLLLYDAATTNLTQDEFNKLNSQDGLTLNLTINADSTKTLEFTVKVTGTPGTKINNVATYIIDEKEEKAKDPEEYQIEREVKITKNSENIKTTNSNIVLVMDISGSMDSNERLKNAKIAAKKLIDGVDFTEGQIGIVTFSSGGTTSKGEWSWNVDNARILNVAEGKTFAVNSDEALTLKNRVDGLKANGGTRIADGLDKAKTLIEKMAEQKPKNNNIVIVLSDAAYNTGKENNDVLSSTGGETVSRVTEKANKLKNSSVKPQVYTIAVLAKDETTGNTDIMTKIIPSSEKNYIKATDGYDNLIKAFKNIEKDISEGKAETRLSKDGLIELDELKTIDSIMISIGGQKVSNPQEYLKTDNGKTYVDLTKINDQTSEIEIEYMT